MGKKGRMWLLVIFFCLGTVGINGGDWRDELARMMDIEEEVLWSVERADMLGSLEWTGQSIAQTQYTFHAELDLTGTAEPGTLIYYGILIQERGGLNLWEKHRVEVGNAGLVQEKLTLPRTGDQYIIVLVQEENIHGCIYRICRRSQELEEELRNFRMNLYEVCS